MIPTLAFQFQTSPSVSLSAAIDTNDVTLYGYGPPNAKIELENSKVYSQTYSQNDGFFEFSRILLPKTHQDLCLVATDDSGRLTPPVCISNPPSVNYHTDIGPIILPPTLSLDPPEQNSVSPASGQAIPNSLVTISFYQTDNLSRSFPRPVSAFSLPRLEVKSDDRGYFNFSLPTSYQNRYRFFATASFEDNPGPKSLSLTYQLAPASYLSLLPLLIFLLTCILTILYLLRRQKSPPRFLPALPSKICPVIRTYFSNR